MQLISFKKVNENPHVHEEFFFGGDVYVQVGHGNISVYICPNSPNCVH